MSMQFRALAMQASEDGALSDDDMLALRSGGWGDARVDADEAEALFEINERLHDVSPEWVEFFVEAISEYLITGANPRGYVNETQADWLIGQFERDGKLESLAELELLARLFEKALAVPERLKSFALAQIESAVLTGCGPTRGGGALEPGKVNDTECHLLRRFVFASGGDRPAAVSQREAEMLFRIKDASIGHDNADCWEALFVQGVGNYLQGFSSYEPLSAERAAELEQFMNQTAHGVGSFFARMASSVVDGGMARLAKEDAPARDLDAEVSAANRVTGEEMAWLDAQIESDSRLDPFEKALLEFLKDS